MWVDSWLSYIEVDGTQAKDFPGLLPDRQIRQADSHRRQNRSASLKPTQRKAGLKFGISSV